MELNFEQLNMKVERLGTQVDEKMDSRENSNSLIEMEKNESEPSNMKDMIKVMVNKFGELRKPMENQMRQLREQMEELKEQMEILKNHRQQQTSQLREPLDLMENKMMEVGHQKE